MTLQDLFNLLGDTPIYILVYFLIIPFTALLVLLLGRGEGHLSPWKYLYSVLIYAVCVPAIFAVTLSVYLFLFERRSILQTDILTQILPIIAMIATLFLISKNVPLERVPGFGKISGLIMIITATLVFMWFIDRTHIIAFTRIPFYYVILAFIGLLLIIRFGWSRIFSQHRNQYEEEY